MTNKTIVSRLRGATTEEAVKAAYVSGFGLKFDNPLRADLYVPPVLFEFKYRADLDRDIVRAKVLAQALYYVRDIRHRALDVAMPVHVCCADRNQAVLTPVAAVIDLVDGAWDWCRAPSSPDPELVAAVAAKALPNAVYGMDSESGVQEFGAALRLALSDDTVPMRRRITASNFEAVYGAWTKKLLPFVEHNGINEPWAFVQDACLRTVVNPETGAMMFEISGDKAQVSVPEYGRFWSGYERPPDRKSQETLLASVDRLAAIDKRRRQGMFYTQEPFCTKALEYLDRALGEDWQDRYWIYDPCCGTGNLEMPLKRYDRLFMSTLEQEEVDYIVSENLFPGATVFQYDFLNDDYDKLPQGLRSVLKSGEPVVVLMNPPYAEATSGVDGKAHKTGVSFTATKACMRERGLGRAANELSTQFMWRTFELCPSATVALFSKLNLFCTPTLETFRQQAPADFRNGFVFHCRNFHGTKGEWPVAFSVLDCGVGGFGLGDAKRLDVLDDDGNVLGVKVVHPPIGAIHGWFKRPPNTEPAVPLSSAIKVSKIKGRLDTVARGALGYYAATGGDVQNYNTCCLLSSPQGKGHGSSVTPDNFEKAMVVLAARKAIAPTWLNDRDQFSVPNPEPGPELIGDCAVWNLFSSHNQASSFTATYNGREMFIDNQFHPFPNSMAADSGPPNPGFQRQVQRMADETWVCGWLKGRELSPEAKALVRAGEAVYKLFFANWNNVQKRKWCIENSRCGFYQIRNALSEAELGGEELAALKQAANTLKLKIAEAVYSHNMLPTTQLY